MVVARIRVVMPLLIAAALVPGIAVGAEHPLSLGDAIERALRRNDALVIERESAVAAEAAVRGARGAYDPVLGIDGTWRKAKEPVNAPPASPADGVAPEVDTRDAGVSIRQLLPTGGSLVVSARGGRATTEGSYALLSPAYGTRAGVELRQPLLRNLSIDAARLSTRVAAADRRAAVASLRRVVTETVAAVELAYWRLVAVRQAVRVGEEGMRLAEEQLGETQDRIESGMAPGTELAQPRAELERRRGEVLEGREIVARAENTLKLLILGDGEETLWASAITPTDSAVVVDDGPIDVPAALAQALEARPELEAFGALVERRKVEGAYARDRRWPQLDAVVSYDRYGLSGSSNPAGSGGSAAADLDGDLGDSVDRLGDGDFDAVRAALVLELPVMNRTARAEAEIARSLERQAEQELTRARKRIRAEVLDAAAALETARQRIEAARAARRAAEVQLEAESDRYANGLSTNFLVLTRQNDLSGARLDEISALTDYRVAQTAMARATGALAADRNPNVDGAGQ